MPGTNARNTGLPVVHVLRKTVTLNDLILAGAVGVLVGTLPANSFLLQAYVRVETIFNAGSTNVLTVGTNAAVNDIAAAADITEGSLQTQLIPTGAGLTLNNDTDVFVKYVQTGTPATTGQATIIVGYIPPI
jgi:hypothetical protein